MNIPDFSIQFLIYGIALLAIFAFLLNLKFKIPKKVFLFLSVFMVVAITWYAFEGGKATAFVQEKPEKNKIKIVPVSFNEIEVRDGFEISFQGKESNISEFFLLIDAPNSVEDILEKIDFLFIDENGEERKNLFVFVDNKLQPQKICAFFKLEKEIELNHLCKFKIITKNLQSYTSKAPLIKIILK